MSNTITLTQGEYDELIRASEKLLCLEMAGVDNWEGYDDAIRELSGEEESYEDIYGSD